MRKQQSGRFLSWMVWLAVGGVIVVLGLHLSVSYTNNSSRVYVRKDPAGGYTTVKVPANFSVRAIHNYAGELQQLWLIADASSWAAEATREGCKGDMDLFVRESASVRSDLSLMLFFFAGQVRMESLFENYKASRNVEQSIVSTASNDPEGPRKFLLDISDRVKTSAPTFADCYYADVPNWYCNIEMQLGRQVMGRFGLPKGLSKQWPTQIEIMKCVVERMMHA